MNVCICVYLKNRVFLLVREVVSFKDYKWVKFLKYLYIDKMILDIGKYKCFWFCYLYLCF